MCLRFVYKNILSVNYVDLSDISIKSFIAIFSLLSRYDAFLFVITIIAIDIVKGYRYGPRAKEIYV